MKTLFWGSSRPISPLNADLKILSQILAQAAAAPAKENISGPDRFYAGETLGSQHEEALQHHQLPQFQGSRGDHLARCKDGLRQGGVDFPLFFHSWKIWFEFRIPVLDEVAVRQPGCVGPSEQA